MTEAKLEPEISERISAFREAFADVMGEHAADVDRDYLVNAILTVGLDLMMVDFFHRLDNDTLKKSLEQFYASHPRLQRVEPVEYCDNELANMHAELSRRYPKQFFQFMFEKMKTVEWAQAREQFRRLFTEDGD